MKFWMILAIGVLLEPPIQAGERVVPLKVTEPVGLDRESGAVIGGAPVEPLGVGNVRELGVFDGKGERIQAQISPLVTNESGILTWVLIDLRADVKAHATARFELRRVSGPSGVAPDTGRGVEAAILDDRVILDNGFLRLELSKEKFNLFDGVRLDPAGGGKYGENVMASNPPAALVLVRGKDKASFASRDGRVERVALEDPGHLRTTLRVDGTYGDGRGGIWLKYTTRITIQAGDAGVRVQHAIRNVNPELEQQEQIARASLTVALADRGGPKDYLVGGGDIRMSRLTRSEAGMPKGSQWHKAVRLSQVGAPEPVLSKTHRTFYKLTDFEQPGFRVEQVQPGDRRPYVDVGFQCKGWIDLMGDSGGCLMYMPTFAFDVPKAMEAGADGTLRLDLIPEHAGRAQPYYADGGYWLGDRTYRTYDIHLHFHAKPMLSEADWVQWSGQMSCYVPPTTETAAAAEGRVHRLKHPLRLVSTPEWYTRTGGMWGEMPSLKDEETAARAMGFSGVNPARPDPRHDLALDFLHYENYHYRSEWDEPGDSILEYLRTGEWNHHRRAMAFGDNYRDLGVPRTDGLDIGKRGAGAKGAGPILRWGKFCGCHKFGSGVIDLWLVTGDRGYRDAGIDFGYDEARLQARWAGFGNRDWGRQMIGVIRTYQVTRDPRLKAYLVKYCTPRVPDEKLREDGRAMICGLHQSSWMTALCSHAVWHNWVLHRGEYSNVEADDYRDQIVGMARQVARWWFSEKLNSGPYNFDFDTPKPGDIQINGGGDAYSASCVDMITRGYLLTGDRHLLDSAAKFWKAMNPKGETNMVVRLQDFQGMGANSFWCRQLIHALAHPRADGEAPAAVADLKAESLEGGKVRLSWTAPADAGGAGGGANVYQVKHAPRPMVTFEQYRFPDDQGQKWTWWAGYNVAGEPVPGAPGTAESLTVEGVPAGERHFCLVSRDGSENESELSNVARTDVRP